MLDVWTSLNGKPVGCTAVWVLDEYWCCLLTFAFTMEVKMTLSNGAHKPYYFWGQCEHLASEKNHHLTYFLLPPLSFCWMGEEGGYKSCFDTDAVRELAGEDSKHCLCRTFKINPSATGLDTPFASLSPSLFPRAFLPLFLSPLSVMCLLLSENRGGT